MMPKQIKQVETQSLKRLLDKFPFEKASVVENLLRKAWSYKTSFALGLFSPDAGLTNEKVGLFAAIISL